MSTELKLELSELIRIANTVEQGIIVCSKIGTIEYANPFIVRLFGHDKEELLGTNINKLSTSILIGPSTPNEKHQVNELHALNKYGTPIYLNATIMPSSTPDNFVVLFSDVTRRVIGQNKLLQKIQVCEKLTRSRAIRGGALAKAIEEILVDTCNTLEVSRVNAWLIDENFTLIDCIGNFILAENKFTEKEILYRKDMPAYFKLLETQEIITTDDTFRDPKTSELVEVYLKKYGITSMMDVPIRIEGEMIGVVCFEHTGIPRKWDLTERKFGLFIAQLLSLAIETNKRQIAQSELEKNYKEKELLLAELNHRVKNNLTMISSLLNLQQSKAKDDYHVELFKESRNRILSISSIHDLLTKEKDFSSIDFASYINEIINLLKASYNERSRSISISSNIEPVKIEVQKAIPLGLIVNEIISNCFKHAFKNDVHNKIEVYLRGNKNKFVLEISDNGCGIANMDAAREKGTLGLSLIYDLADQIDARIEYSGKNGSTFDIYFQAN